MTTLSSRRSNRDAAASGGMSCTLVSRPEPGHHVIPEHDNAVAPDADATSSPPLFWTLGAAALAVAMQLWLVWGYAYFPSVDGPAHVHLAYAFHEVIEGDSFYRDLVELNPLFNPNMATQAMLVALMWVAPPFIAEKLWLTLYFVSFASAGAYALRGINRNALCLLPLLMFCSVSLPLAFGFYNFAFGSVVLLAWFGYWWRHRREASLRIVVTHAALSFIALGVHIFALVVTVLAIATTGSAAIALQITASEKDSHEQTNWLREFSTHGLLPFLGSLPALAVAAYFLFGRFGTLTASGAANMHFDVFARLQAFIIGTSFFPYDDNEFLAAALFVPAAIGIAWASLRSRRTSRSALPLAICFASFLTMYILMPPQWIVRWMPSRFQPAVFIVLLLWLAALLPNSHRPLQWRLIAGSGLVLIALSLWARIPLFDRLDSYYEELVTAGGYIRPDSTLVALRTTAHIGGHPFPAKVDVLIQSGSLVASQRHSVDLKNFQGQADDHPIQFKPGIGAADALGGDAALISLSPRIDLMAYERQTGRTIDYVLLYGFRQFPINPDGLARIESQLLRHYALTYESPSNGFVRLYQRRQQPH